MALTCEEMLRLLGLACLCLRVLPEVVAEDSYLNEVQSSAPLSCSEGFTELGYYNGTVVQTDSGAPCLKWTEFPDYVLQYPGRGLGDHSYCRNPDRESNPWCFFRQNSGAIGWAYCDCHQGAARLVGSSSSDSGRVEVYLNGQWGAVCDSHWTDRDASVICRQLGLGEIGTALKHSQFGTGSGIFHYERMGCRGDEGSLSNCRSRTFVTGDCSHGNEAGLACAPPEGSGPPLRLVGGEEEFEGRVEVFHKGRWGSVCDDQWDDSDAEVVCRQLGFGGVAKAWSWAHYGQGSGPIMLDAVKCSGNELFLGQCRHGDWEQHNCDHMEDAGVSCSPYSDGVVRLVGGDSPWEGRVEVFHNGDWGTVCDDQWSERHAQVVCRELGYRGHAEVVEDGAFGEGTGLILLDDVSCDGSEASLLDCRRGIWGRTDCSHGEDVGVRCRGGASQETNEVPVIAPSTGPLVRLVGGSGRTQGRVEVYLHGDWGSICDSGWNDLNAAVVCRQLGHSGGAVARGGFGQGKGPIHLDRVRCTGKEEFLGECPSLGQGPQSCRRREDAGVACDVSPPPTSLSPSSPSTTTTTEKARPQDVSCGLRKLTETRGKTKGEEDVPLGSSWPWQVSVWLQTQGRDGGPLCSGTLINPCWALTSAHCFTRYGSSPSTYVVRVGASPQTLSPERVVVHRKYKGQSGGHDLALVRLPSGKGHCLTFDPDTNAACLPSPDRAVPSPPTSCITTVTTGWDGEDSVVASWVPLMSPWQCKKHYGDSFSSHGTLCAGSPPDTSRLRGDGCPGTTGGGLVCQDEGGRWVLTGLVAGGYGCGGGGGASSPALYTRVNRFRGWVEEVVGAHLAARRLGAAVTAGAASAPEDRADATAAAVPVHAHSRPHDDIIHGKDDLKLSKHTHGPGLGLPKHPHRHRATAGADGDGGGGGATESEADKPKHTHAHAQHPDRRGNAKSSSSSSAHPRNAEPRTDNRL